MSISEGERVANYTWVHHGARHDKKMSAFTIIFYHLLQKENDFHSLLNHLLFRPLDFRIFLHFFHAVLRLLVCIMYPH